MSIERIYTRNVVSAPRSASLQQAALLMRDNHIGTLVVTDDEAAGGGAVGIVTDRDLVIHGMAAGVMPDELALDRVMTPGLVGVSSNAELHEALEVMRAGGVRRLAVTNGTNTIIGILSLDDVVDAIAADLSSLAGIIRTEQRREDANVRNSAADMTAPGA